MSDHAKQFLDGASIMTAIATFAGWLPNIAALLAIIWTLIRIWETETVRKIVRSLCG